MTDYAFGANGTVLHTTAAVFVATTIGTRDVLFLPVDENDPTGDCFSNISGVQIGGATQWLVGGVLLKNVYFSTNVDENIMQRTQSATART